MAVVRLLYSKFYPQLTTSFGCGDIQIPTSFQNVKSLIIRGQNFESGPNTYYFAKSVLPFNATPSPPVTASGVTDSHLQNTWPINVLYYALHRLLPSIRSTYTRSDCTGLGALAPYTSEYIVHGQIWCSNLFEPSNKNAFLPVENMRSQLLTGEYVLFVFSSC